MVDSFICFEILFGAGSRDHRVHMAVEGDASSSLFEFADRKLHKPRWTIHARLMSGRPTLKPAILVTGNNSRHSAWTWKRKALGTREAGNEQ